jgi:hypothetical protein
VVRVGVGERDRLDVAEAEAHGGEVGLERVGEARHAGVDDREPSAVLDGIEVDELVAEPPDSIRDGRHHA